MYAAVADLKRVVRDLLLIILTLFKQFQRQAYRNVRSGLHILNMILFELVAVFYICSDRMSCSEPSPKRGCFRNVKAVVLLDLCLANVVSGFTQ